MVKLTSLLECIDPSWFKWNRAQHCAEQSCCCSPQSLWSIWLSASDSRRMPECLPHCHICSSSLELTRQSPDSSLQQIAKALRLASFSSELAMRLAKLVRMLHIVLHFQGLMTEQIHLAITVYVVSYRLPLSRKICTAVSIGCFHVNFYLKRQFESLKISQALHCSEGFNRNRDKH